MLLYPDGRIPSQDVAVMISEFLALLNHCRPSSAAIASILPTTLECIMTPMSSSHSIVTLPFISAACQSLASMAHMVAVLEAAIMTHFSGCNLVVGAAGNQLSWLWSEVLTMLEIPELSLDEFLQACVSGRALLTLYTHVLKHLPQCVNLKEEFVILEQVVQWCSNVQLT